MLYNVTPDTLGAVFKKMAPGDTLDFGEHTYGRGVLGMRVPNITYDFRKATLTGSEGCAEQQGITILGGRWTAPSPLRITGGEDVKVIGMRCAGDPASRTGSAVMVTGVPATAATPARFVKKVLVEDIEARSYRNLLVLQLVDGFEARKLVGRDLSADGVQMIGVRNGWIDDVDVDEARPGGSHPDAVQGRGLPGIATQDIRISRVRARGMIQGVNFTNHGEPRFQNIAVEDCDLEVHYSAAVAINKADGVRFRNIRARQFGEPVEYHPRIEAPLSTDVVYEGDVIAEAAGRFKEIVYSTAAPPAAPSTDAERIASLTADLETAKAALTTLEAEKAQLTADLNAARVASAEMAAAFDLLVKERDAALTKIADVHAMTAA